MRDPTWTSEMPYPSLSQLAVFMILIYTQHLVTAALLERDHQGTTAHQIILRSARDANLGELLVHPDTGELWIDL
jgi:hypothetical protein